MHKHPRIAPRRAVHDTHDMMLNTEQALEKLIQYATVEQLDCTGALVRVRAGDNLTDWVRWFGTYSGAHIDWSAPSIGEQGMLLSPSGILNNGAFLRGLPSEQFQPPSHEEQAFVIRFKNGDTITHDGSQLIFNIAGGITHQTPKVTHTGDTQMQGDTQTGGNAQFAADVGVAGSISNQGTNVGHDHTHTHVQTGSDNTGGPQ